jgi:hypothetical protein
MTRHFEPEDGNSSTPDEKLTGYRVAGDEGKQAIL